MPGVGSIGVGSTGGGEVGAVGSGVGVAIGSVFTGCILFSPFS